MHILNSVNIYTHCIQNAKVQYKVSVDVFKKYENIKVITTFGVFSKSVMYIQPCMLNKFWLHFILIVV